MALKIHRISRFSPVDVEAERFIVRLKPETMFKDAQQFNSVQFVTTAIPDPKNASKTVIQYEAYILYYG
jgi:hypothetical protein